MCVTIARIKGLQYQKKKKKKREMWLMAGQTTLVPQKFNVNRPSDNSSSFSASYYPR